MKACWSYFVRSRAVVWHTRKPCSFGAGYSAERSPGCGEVSGWTIWFTGIQHTCRQWSHAMHQHSIPPANWQSKWVNVIRLDCGLAYTWSRGPRWKISHVAAFWTCWEFTQQRMLIESSSNPVWRWWSRCHVVRVTKKTCRLVRTKLLDVFLWL